MNHKKVKHWVMGLVAIAWLAISIVFTQFNASLYEDTIMRVTSVSLPESLVPELEQEQVLQGVMLNGPTKGQELTLTVPVSYSEAVAPVYHKGVDVFLTQDLTTIKSVKRDRYVLLLLGLFMLIVWWVGRGQGGLSLVSVALNVVMLLVALELYSHQPQLPLSLVIFVAGSITTTLSLGLGLGWHKKTATTILATLLASTSAWLLGWFVLALFHDKGLRYEDMQFLTRPYRQIFMSSLFLGTLGAAMDIAITVVSTVTELLVTTPQIGRKQLANAGRSVGKNVMGSMASVLLFAYLSGGIPLIVLYLKNQWDFLPAVEMTLSLEIARALVGAIGIVLTIPISVLVVTVLYRKQVK